MEAKKSMLMALVTAMIMSLVSLAWADNGTEFGIEDDLTVLGDGGDAADPDVEILGFVRIGTTSVSPNIPAAPGNIFVIGKVEVSSGIYVTGSSTFTERLSLTGGPSSIFISGGYAGQILKKSDAGHLEWATLSGLIITGTPYRLTMIQSGGSGLTESKFLQTFDGSNYGITLLDNSSMTVTGAFEANGLAKLTNSLEVTGNASVTNNLTVSGNATVNGNTTLGDSASDWIVAKSSTTIDIAGGPVDTSAALAVKGLNVSGNYSAKFYQGGSLAAWIRKK